MNIKTERLALVPLDAEALRLLTTDQTAFESRMGVIYDGEPMEGFIRDFFVSTLQQVETAGDRYPLITFWLFHHIELNKYIGSACFKGWPNAQGHSEIGYGIHTPYEGQGYTTEAVKALIQWGEAQPEVKQVIAETEKNNPASMRIMEKCGMLRYMETEEAYWWYHPQER